MFELDFEIARWIEKGPRAGFERRTVRTLTNAALARELPHHLDEFGFGICIARAALDARGIHSKLCDGVAEKAGDYGVALERLRFAYKALHGEQVLLQPGLPRVSTIEHKFERRCVCDSLGPVQA
jgi:hypothetical protein